MRRVDVNFFEMGQIVGQHLDQPEATSVSPVEATRRRPFRAAVTNLPSSVVSASMDSGA